MRNVESRELLLRELEASGIQSRFQSDLETMACLLEFDAGEFLIRKGVVSQYLYFLVRGKIKFFEVTASAKRVTYGYSRSSGALGEVASLWGRKPRISVQAVEPCVCVAIDLSVYREALFNDNVFLRYLCELLSERVAILDNNIANLMLCPIESRLAAFILQNAKDGVFKVSLTECAEFTATSYRHLIRIMNKFCEQGVLKRASQQFEILDAKTLAALAEEAYAYYI